MKSRLFVSISLVCLGALASLASAAPTATPTAATPPKASACPKLTAAECKADPRWSSVDYCSASYTRPSAPSEIIAGGVPDGMKACSAKRKAAALDPCTKVQAAACKDTIQAALKNDPARKAAPTQTLLKVGGQNLPKDLRDDGRKRGTYGKPKKGRELKVGGKSVIARSGLTNPPANVMKFADAANHHRKPAWDTNGEEIKSCQEFAYEELYDGMRYIDAVGACAGDRACEVEIAYLKTTPGIARRTLKRKDGKTIERQLKVRDTGTMLKNDLFLAKRQLAYALDPVVDRLKTPAHGDPTKLLWKHSAEMDELAALLDEGKQWYSFGCKSGCGTRKFKNEWDFHDKLRERNKLMSAAEFAEYERRKAKFRELHEAWVAAAAAGLAGKVENKKQLDARKNKPRVATVSRIDAQSADPFERVERMTEALSSVEVMQGKGGGAPIGLPNAGQQVGGSYRGKGTAALGMLAAPVSATKKPGVKPPAKLNAPHCSPSHWAGRNPNLDDLYFGGPAACALADFLREEYRRKAAGHKSCLDLGNDDCDWSPETFHGRFVASFPYGKELQGFESQCEQWTGGDIEAANLVAAEKYIAKMKKLVKKALKQVKPYEEAQVDVAIKGNAAEPSKKMWKLGQDWADAESFGDKDWFAAGYDYDVGWHIHPVALSAEKKMCALTGNAHGNFGVDAWLLGADVDVVEAQSQFETNKKNSGESHLAASLQILDQQLFAPVDETFTTTWAPSEPLGGSMDLPPGWKPSITIMAGPVPVTGSAWGSIFYDAALSAETKLAKTKGACEPKNVQFLMHGLVEPELGVAGYAEVGAGIGGLLSAGIRGTVTLVSLGIPFNALLQARNMAVDASNEQPTASFNASIGLAVSTLSGYISLYIEILFVEDEWELFSWSGVSSEVALMDPALEADLPLLGWPE